MWILMMLANAGPISDRDLEKQQCNLGNAKACTGLALRYQLGQGAPKDTVYAMELFKKGCTLGDASGCVHRADAYRNGTGVRRNPARAIELYTRSCTQDLLGRACRALGEIYILGDGVERSSTFSSLYYGQGCAAGDGESCVGEGLGIERGDFKAPNPEHARKQMLRACELKHARGCTLLGERYLNGLDGPKDLAGAAKLFKSGCELQDAASCRYLGRMAKKGKGITKSPELAKTSFLQGCAMNDYEACVDLADLLKKSDVTAAANAAARACSMGYEPGCAKEKQLSWLEHMQSLRGK